MALTFNAEAFNVSHNGSPSLFLHSVFGDGMMLLELVGRLSRGIGLSVTQTFFSRKIRVCMLRTHTASFTHSCTNERCSCVTAVPKQA